MSLLYQDGPLLREIQEGNDFAWLPEGRSVIRDKRIQRENLNGLQIKNTGIDRVVTLITGVGSHYAQNPPHFAEVIAFETNEERDIAHTRLSDWEGWTHNRWIDFRHNNEPVLVVDRAFGPTSGQAQIVWHPVNVVPGGNLRYLPGNLERFW